MDTENSLLMEITNKKELKQLESVCKKFDITIKRVYKVRSAYKVIDYSNKIYCVKRSKNGRRKVLNSYRLTEDLYFQGFLNTPRYIKTTKGNVYIKHKNDIFSVTEWVNGRECDFRNFDEAIESVKLLAKFHVSTSRMDHRNYKITNNLKNWPRLYKKSIEDLEVFKHKINKKILKTEFDYRYYNEIDKFISIALTSLNLLNITPYYKISRDAEDNKTICHDSFYYQNILKTFDDYYLIDLNSVIIDLRVNDLGKFIRRLMYKTDYAWDFRKAQKLIEEYSVYNPLSKEELQIMLSLIYFPYKFWKIGKKRYIKHKNWTEEKYNRRLDKILLYKESKIRFFKEYINYLEQINNTMR